MFGGIKAQHQHNMANMKMDSIAKPKMDTLSSTPHKYDMKSTDMKLMRDTVLKKKQNMKTMGMNIRKDAMNMKVDGMEMDGMKMDGDMKIENMSHAYSLSLPMNRNGSGTSWMPDNTPMYMIMKRSKKDMWMFHGNIFLRYNTQELTNRTARSASQFDAPNWFMAMYNRKVGKNGLFHFSSMFSLDALTVGNSGYPLLFQSGEAYQGKALVDRQHPHDLFSELSVSYSQRLTKNVDVFGYFGYPGEPALGPTAFMHRTSTMNDPDAPLGHHWQDATHITFGVATVGIRLNKFKLETSRFTGREPDKHRYDFDKATFNSFSYRISYNPSRAWALQVSQGYLKSPESLHPNENIWKYTASGQYNSTVTKKGKYVASTFVFGLNDAGFGHKQQSYLAESNFQLNNKNAVYGRYEFVQKSAEELDIETTYGDRRFDINKITAGYNHVLFSVGTFAVAAGTQFSLNIVPSSLQNLYGVSPISGQVYLQFRPRLML